LELNGGRDVVLVLSICMEEVTALASVAVGAATLGVDSVDVGRAVVVCCTGLSCLLTDHIFPATVETLLEGAHIHHSIDWN
jgi:hypothetical protein